jgi:hypothetical protein
MARLYAVFSAHPFEWFGILGFVFAAVTAVLIQLVLLPYVFPAWHAGHGLLVGGDWFGTHQTAAALSSAISHSGWQEWQLRPYLNAPAGIAAIFYTLIAPEPWVMIPLNAAMHALSAVLLAKIVWMVTGRAGISILAALPFLLYPSATTWYAQIHKDGYFIAGFFAILYGWLRLNQYETWRANRYAAPVSVLWIVSGTILIGVVRDYGVQLMVVLGSLYALVASVRLLRAGFQWPRWRLGFAIGLLLSIPLVTNMLSTNHYKTNAMIVVQNQKGDKDASGRAENRSIAETWRWSPSVPRSIDEIFYTLSVLRQGFATGYSAAQSTIDRDVRFKSAFDFIPYLPRAAQIGFLAPFPSHWLAPGHSPGGSLMRRLAGVEMIGVYCALLFLPYAAWRWRRRVEIWLVLSGCVSAIMLYTYVVPNIGALYRMRYGFLMLLVGVGFAGCLSALKLRASGRAGK